MFRSIANLRNMNMLLIQSVILFHVLFRPEIMQKSSVESKVSIVCILVLSSGIIIIVSNPSLDTSFLSLLTVVLRDISIHFKEYSYDGPLFAHYDHNNRD